MRIILGGAVMGVLLGFAVPSADAGIFSWMHKDKDKPKAGVPSYKQKLPKSIDYPMVRPKIRDDHKAIKRLGRHPQ